MQKELKVNPSLHTILEIILSMGFSLIRKLSIVLGFFFGTTATGKDSSPVSSFREPISILCLVFKCIFKPLVER